MKPTTFLSFVLLLLHSTDAKNDWSKPCLSGSCSFDITRSNTSMAATLSINGSSSSISDITTAAGWSILNCSASAESQTIQLVCTDESKGCSHLFQEGAENTIVRLPEDCGAAPFARVAHHSISANQSVPPEIASKIQRRNSASPQVQSLQIDTNFADSSSGDGQTVDFSLFASTDPDLSISPPSPPSFSDTTTGSSPIAFNEGFILFNKISQGLALSVDANVEVNFVAQYSVQIGGSIIPPTIKTFVLTPEIDGTFDALINFVAELTGAINTGNINLLNIGFPGLSIAGIFTMGPQFVLNADTSGTVQLPANLSVGIAYELDDLSFTVGNSQATQAGFTFVEAPFQSSLDNSNSLTARTSATVHLIPTLEFGLNSFGETGTVSAPLSSGLLISLTATGNGPAHVICEDVSIPHNFKVGASGNFFGVITETLNETIFSETFAVVGMDIFNFADSSNLAMHP